MCAGGRSEEPAPTMGPRPERDPASSPPPPGTTYELLHVNVVKTRKWTVGCNNTDKPERSLRAEEGAGR